MVGPPAQAIDPALQITPLLEPAHIHYDTSAEQSIAFGNLSAFSRRFFAALSLRARSPGLNVPNTKSSYAAR